MFEETREDNLWFMLLLGYFVKFLLMPANCTFSMHCAAVSLKKKIHTKVDQTWRPWVLVPVPCNPCLIILSMCIHGILFSCCTGHQFGLAQASHAIAVY